MSDAGRGINLTRAGDLAQHRDALRLQAEKLAQSYQRGSHGRRRAGAGEKFWQFRPYHAGDMPRDIDWRQTAKRDDVFVREREHDSAQSLWLWRDSSASMHYSSTAKILPKSDYAEVLLLALATLAAEAGERIGALGAGQGARSHASAVIGLQQQLYAAPSVPDGALATASPRAVCVLASDFYMDLAGVDAACAALAARQCRVVLVQICDSAEEKLSWHGRVRFEDPETSGEHRLIDDVDALRRDYLEKFTAHRHALRDIAIRHAGVMLDIVTATPLHQALAMLIDQVAQPDLRGG